jgi:hypothetical protein
MSLIHLILVLIVVGVLLWLVNTYIPMDRKIKQILNIVVVIVVVLWLLQVFGVLGAPRARASANLHCAIDWVRNSFHNMGDRLQSVCVSRYPVHARFGAGVCIVQL